MPSGSLHSRKKPETSVPMANMAARHWWPHAFTKHRQPGGERLTPAGVAGLGRALRLADEESERTAALIRVAILAALTVAVTAAEAIGSHHHPLTAAALVYAAGTLVGLFTAWRRLFHPLLPYCFVAFDIVTLAFGIALLGRAVGLPPGLSYTLPVSGLVLIVLLHASMRYRPALILFGAALFVVSLWGVSFAVDAGRFDAWQPVSDQHHLLHFQVFPIVVFVLAAVILFITTRHTRKFIADAFSSASRAAALARYFSPGLVDELAGRAGDEAVSGARRRVAVLFADLQGFTAMAEGMDPAELSQYLSEFRARIAEPVAAHGGVVDKYIGDAIMAVFGAPLPADDDARRALACALAMADCMETWSAQRMQEGKPPVAIGIGGHYGEVFAGVLSDGRLLEYTVIGDTVNVARRLTRLPRSLETPLVVSAALVEAAGSLPHEQRWERLSPQELLGHPRPISVFRLRRQPHAFGAPTLSPAFETSD